MATHGFVDVTIDTCWAAVTTNALAFVVLRTILGVSPPEWQDLTLEELGESFPPNTARSIDGKIKRDANFFATPAGSTDLMVRRVRAMLSVACTALHSGAAIAPEGLVHRLDKVDTSEGVVSIRHAAEQHVPYAVLLYERFLGGAYASHRRRLRTGWRRHGERHRGATRDCSDSLQEDAPSRARSWF